MTSVETLRWAPSHVGDLGRRIVVIGASAIVAGILVGGVGARAFMRVAAITAVPSAQGRLTEAGFRVGEITFDNSVGLILSVGIFGGIIGAAFLVVFEPWLAWAGRWRGAVFGVLLFAATSASSDVLNPDNIDFRILDNTILVVPMILALFVAYGVAVLGAQSIVERLLPSANSRTGSTVYTVLATLGVMLGLPLLPVILVAGGFCGCSPPLIVATFVIVTMAGTLLWWINCMRRDPSSRTAGTFIGSAGLLGTMAFGLARAVSDSIEVLRL